MSGYRKRSLQRVDGNAKMLIDEVKKLGAKYLPLNTIIDGLVLDDDLIYLVDWKMPNAEKTDSQVALEKAGWPIRFCSTVDDVRRMLGGWGD